MNTQQRTLMTFRVNGSESAVRTANLARPGRQSNDVAKELLGALREHGIAVDDTPSREDFGSYFRLSAEGHDHCFVVGHQAGDDGDDARWIAWVERDRGFAASVVGLRSVGIAPAATRLVHEALLRLPGISKILWHVRRDFDRGVEDLGVPEPE